MNMYGAYSRQLDETILIPVSRRIKQSAKVLGKQSEEASTVSFELFSARSA